MQVLRIEIPTLVLRNEISITPPLGCSPTIQRYGCKQAPVCSVEWSTNIPGMVITFPRLVTHHFQDGQLDMEFDSSEAQIVLLLLLLIPKQTFKAWSKSGEFNCFIVVVDSRSKSRVSNSWHNNGDIEFPVCRGGICKVVVLSIGCGWVRGLTIILRGCPPPLAYKEYAVCKL